MLTRLEWIKESGHFEDYRWDTALPDLARVNVIYGSNGMGKTSLAGALDGARHLEGGYGRISLEINESGKKRTTNGGDDGIFDRIHVFSERFIERSHRFHEGSPNLDAVLTLGEKTAEAEERIAELREELTKKTEERDQAQRDRSAADRATTQAHERVSIAVVSDLSRVEGYRNRGSYSSGTVKNKYAGDRSQWATLTDEELASKKQFVSSDNRELLDTVNFTLAPDSALKDRAQALLGATPITTVLDTLQAHPEATSWVQQGQPLHEDSEVCLYCGNPLSESRKHDIEQHFSDEVSRLQTELDGLAEDLDSLKSEVEGLLQAIPTRALLFEDLRTEFDAAEKAVRDQSAALVQWVDSLSQRLATKRANVLGSVENDLEDAPQIVGGELGQLCVTHNQRVSEHATLLAASAQAIEFHHLKAEESVVDSQAVARDAAESNRAAAAGRIEEIETEIAALENVEGDPTPSAEVLTREVARLLGRSELVFHARDGTYVVTRDGEPATGLSIGERSAIALVHFLEAVARHDLAKGKPIVVIDDPVSSLDSNVFMGISTYIWSETVASDRVDQVVVLTHNFDLFKQWDVQIESMHRSGKFKRSHPAEMYELKSRHVNRKGRMRREPVLVRWPESEAVRKKIRSSYHHAFMAIAESKQKLAADDSLENRLDAQLLFPNVIRRLLESFLAFKRPEWVGDFTDSMRRAGEWLEQSGYQGDAKALRQQLTRYSHAYSHSQTPETGDVVNPDEIGAAIGSVFMFMDQIDHDHFSGMCKVVGLEPADLLPEAPETPAAS